MKKKNILTLFLAAASAAFIFSACAKSPAPETTEPSATAGTAAETTAETTAGGPAGTAPAETETGEETDASEATEETGAAPAGFTDADFLVSVRSGLEDRWASVNQQDGQSMDTEAFRAYASAAVQKELDAIGELYFYSFEDEELAGLASAYCAALKDQLAGISESESQEALKDSESYMTGYCLRTVALYTLREKYGLTVDPQYQENFDSAVSKYEQARQYLGMEE